MIGFVDDVCPVRGCWANVLDATLTRFKVPDREFVFAAKMIGDLIEAMGVFARHTISASGRWESARDPTKLVTRCIC